MRSTTQIAARLYSSPEQLDQTKSQRQLIAPPLVAAGTQHPLRTAMRMTLPEVLRQRAFQIRIEIGLKLNVDRHVQHRAPWPHLHAVSAALCVMIAKCGGSCCAMPTAPRQLPPPPSSRTIPTPRLNSAWDEAWGQRHTRSNGAESRRAFYAKEGRLAKSNKHRKRTAMSARSQRWAISRAANAAPLFTTTANRLLPKPHPSRIAAPIATPFCDYGKREAPFRANRAFVPRPGLISA